jgi:hypothetical protein
MKKIILFLCLLPTTVNASLMLQYGLNFSKSSDETSGDDHEVGKSFHKIFLGASIDGGQKLIFGWNINSWSSTVTKDEAQDEYSVLEMGPKFLWFMNENKNFYTSIEWNPYATGTRTKSNDEKDITGTSVGFSFGYRFRLSKNFGLGASLNYHALSLKKETLDSTESTISDKITNLMPMLEISIMTR